MKDNDKFILQLNNMVETAFRKELSKSKEKIQETSKYKDIEDYTRKTGKRFRMLKSDISEGLSREEAFSRRFNN